jgi:predicted RNA polymerase sigma factor
MADGPAAGLAIVDALRDEPSLARYHLLPSVRGDLLAGSAGTTRRAPSSSARAR